MTNNILIRAIFAISLLFSSSSFAVPSGSTIGATMFQKCYSAGHDGEKGQACCYKLTLTCLGNCGKIYKGADVRTCESACREAGDKCADAFETKKPPMFQYPDPNASKLVNPRLKPNPTDKLKLRLKLLPNLNN